MRLLFVTPYFPPAGGSGVQRGTKFVKYLMRDGWEVAVLTLDPATYHVHDESLSAEVAAAHVLTLPLRTVPGVQHRVLRGMPAFRRGLARAIRRFRPDVLLATTPDFHWVAVARAARRFGIPYVLDYPDPWTVLPDDFRIFREPTVAKSRLKWRVAPEAERHVLAGASAAVFATQPMLDEYARSFAVVGTIGTVITNGFDPEDFPRQPDASPSAKKGGAVVITHAGSFAGRRSPLPMARAIRKAASETDKRLEARFVGDGVVEAKSMLLRELGEAAELVVRPWVAHRDAIAEMQAASILWLDAMIHFRPAATGKIYEYLRTGNPILALAHDESPAADLVRSLNAGRVISSEDPAAVGPVLADMIAQVPAERTEPDLARLAPYDREALAARLSALLASVARRR